MAAKKRMIIGQAQNEKIFEKVKTKARVLMSVVIGLKKTCNIGHDGLNLDKEIVETELSTTFIIYFDYQTFSP